MNSAGASGSDSVSYFEDGIDIFEIDAAAGAAYADLTVSASGTNTLIAYNGNTITLTSTDPSLIDAADFLFV